MGLNRTDQPVIVGGMAGGAAGLVLSTGVAMVAKLCGCLDAEDVAVVLAFGNALIVAGTTLWQYRNAWSTQTVGRVAEVAAATGNAQGAVEAHK